MLNNFILQTTNAPGTGANCSLITAPAGRINFNVKFATGASMFYFLDDGSQSEWGVGTLTTGSPDILSRTTVIGNSANSGSRLNFAGSTRVYNDMPGENNLYKDGTGKVAGTISTTGALIANAVDVANGAQIRATSANYGLMIRNDDTTAYLMQTASGSPLGAFNTFRPFQWTLATGVVSIDQTGVGTFIGGNLKVGNSAAGGGYFCKQGRLGGFGGNVTNLWYDGVGNTQLWIDNTSFGNITTSSDRRYKRNITPLPDTGLDRVMALEPISYNWQNKGLFRDDGFTREGFIAQDVQKIIPSAVSGDETTDSPMSLNDTPISAVAVKAIQELKYTIDALAARISALESK